MQNSLFKLAGLMNILIAIGHIVGLFWAERMFELTGVGEDMQRWSDVHIIIPYAITVVTAVVFFIFGLYGFSAAGVIKPLPLLKPGIILITFVYIFRGISGLFFMNSSFLEIMYSVIALSIGGLFKVGIMLKWGKEV